MSAGRERQQQTEALVAEAYREWESLGLMSYHGDGIGGWWADLDKDGIAHIRRTIAALAARLSGLQDTLAAKDEALRKWQSFFSAGYLAGQPFESTAAIIFNEGGAALALTADGPTTPEDWFVPEGNQRCGYRHKPTGATCLLRRDHDGPHRNTQGHWSRLPQFNDPPAGSVPGDAPTEKETTTP